MINIGESTIINRPAPEVFAFVGDQTNALQALTEPLPRPVFQRRAAFAH